ncbi:AMP-binding protein [Pseudonocardia saturnea]
MTDQAVGAEAVPRGARSVPAFAGDLRGHGDALAVVTAEGAPLTYTELADRVDALVERLGAQRRLVLVSAAPGVPTLVGYLAALRGGHVALLAAAEHVDGLLAAYDPDVVLRGETPHDCRPGTRHELHPDLALLLCTSGSTGSPKLVRLSSVNLESNAASIVDYLGIRATDRAALTLPVQFCYGLSVVNSNLHAGAALLLLDRSVADPQFWADFRRHRGTSIHGVPYTFELLDRAGLDQMELPHLRYVTQAGGRLDPGQVRRWARVGERRGWRLFVMYGQTEATARMAYLPPTLAVTCPSAIGMPIPGGAISLEPTADGDEIVFRGPGVMLGYAEHAADLARGRTVDALRTGDLGRLRPDGLYEVVSRRSRFIKPFGLRIDLGRVEALLAEEGCTAVCAGVDEDLAVLVRHGPDPDALRSLLAERLGLPARHVRVVPVLEFPRLPSGKVDHAAVPALCRAASRGRAARAGRGRRGVREAFRAVFPLADLPDDATFVSLGGDSLSYVRMTVELQRVLGHLPQRWDTTTIGELTRLPRARRSWPAVETAVVMRAVAIVLVVGSHAGFYDWLGGAHLLLGIAGWAFARFVLDGSPGTVGPARILRSAARIAVPVVVWIGWRAAVQDDVQLQNALLLNYVLDPSAWGYWYVETLVQILVVLAVMFAVPAVRRLERARPYPFVLLVLATALSGRAFPDTDNEFSARLFSPHLVLWLFALGWLVHRSTTPARRWVTAALIVALVPTFFIEAARGSVVLFGLLALLLLPRLRVPRAAVRPIGAVASASLAIYLTHYALLADLAWLPPLVATVAAVSFGVVVWTVLHSLAPRAVALLPTRPAREQLAG